MTNYNITDDNYYDRSSDLRELLDEVVDSEDDSVISDISNHGDALPLSDDDLEPSNLSGTDVFIPENVYDSDDSRADSPEPIPRPIPSRPTVPSANPSTSDLTARFSPPTNVPSTSSTSSGHRPRQTPQTLDQNPWVRLYPPENQLDVTSHFMVRNVGPKNCQTSKNPLDYLKLFFTDGIITVIARETNNYAQAEIRRKLNSGQLRESLRLQSWTNVITEEMQRFLSIMIQMALTHRNCISDYWSLDPMLHISWFGQTMSLKRFEAIHAMIHLTSRTTIPRGQPGYDPWVKVRPLLDNVNNAFKATMCLTNTSVSTRA